LNIKDCTNINCKDPEICGPSPLRIMGCALQTWPKSIKFVRGEKEQQQ